MRPSVRMPTGMEQALERAAIARSRRGVLALNDRHPGATIYVIGSSMQVNQLTPAQIELLSHQPAIGLNRTQYRVPTKYFLSSYGQEVGLALRVGGASAMIHLCSMPRPPIPGTLAVWKRPYDEARGLPRRFHGDRPTLYTRRNAALPATHLALIMGARRIVYIGLEQRSNLRFFDEDQALRDRMLADLTWAHEMGYYDIGHPDSTYESHIVDLRRPIEQLATEPYWHVDHTPMFRAFFDELERYGVEPIATTQNSVIYDAGARYVPLDEAIEGPVRGAGGRRSLRPGIAALRR